jgi:hypothetical protein
MILLVFTWIVVPVLFIYRSELTYRHKARSRELIRAAPRYEQQNLIDKYFQWEYWQRPYGYGYMTFNLTKWTFEQFYPELAERERMILQLEVDQERDSPNEIDPPDTKKGG